MDAQPSLGIRSFLASWRQGIWILFILIWCFGLIERGVAVYANSVITALELLQLLTAIFFLLSWLLLKPTSVLAQSNSNSFASVNSDRCSVTGWLIPAESIR
ncbi:MAG: hypothetical protein MUC48_26840 [Leptolyngbya sp. Prado105]|jgi:hypothetical protein|nr:hypothetical protein [Leptolyngbya sp. Prado105]